ncbi:tetratricopeptide repeat protein [Helicobacter pametensis]|uniref:tetratricopeptide repeat protein n=1 Tax=Helicobacter pametensis TaxID=95149 RepID=UPI0004BA5FFC|nr:tetratricopeptide repeat protein [Helicobacter pametensis]
MFYRITFFVGILIFLGGCKGIDPYEGFKAYYFGDYQKALSIYSEACDAGDAFMCHSIGGMFENGLAVKQDYRKAYKYYVMACQNGIPQSCAALAGLYREGKGIRYDLQKTLEYYLMSCDQDLALGCYSAGVMYYNKQGGIQEDKKLTKELFGKACDLGDNKACSIYKSLSEAGY